MFLKPEKTKETIAKAGSTYLINYTELGIRLVIGIAFINVSLFSIYELYFSIIGYFLIITAILLMLVPIKNHNQFSKKAVESLKTIYLEIAAPFSIFFGILLLFAIYNQIQSFKYLN
jgi:hypothetical protein